MQEFKCKYCGSMVTPGFGCFSGRNGYHVAVSDGVHCVYCGEEYKPGFGGCIIGSPRNRHELEEVRE